jgi:purine-binding chemotaxis protein CheW
MRCAMFRDGPVRFLVFRVGVERFAVPMSEVDEVIDAPALQRIPDAAATMLGIAAIRGSFITVYDPRPLLGVEGGNVGAVLLFARGDRRVGLAVDDVFDPLTAEKHELLPAPGADASDGILIGVIRRGSDLIAVLDTHALLNAASMVVEGERT